MADTDVPTDVQQFLHEYLESLAELEILILLQGHSGKALSALEVADELHIRESEAEDALRGLCERGLLSAGGAPGELRFRFGPSADELAQTTRLLAEIYQDQRVAIMRLMTAHSIQRLRAGALGMFSNAFVYPRRRKSRG